MATPSTNFSYGAVAVPIRYAGGPLPVVQPVEPPVLTSYWWGVVGLATPRGLAGAVEVQRLPCADGATPYPSQPPVTYSGLPAYYRPPRNLDGRLYPTGLR